MTQSSPVVTQTAGSNQGTDEKKQGKDIHNCSERRLFMKILTCSVKQSLQRHEVDFVAFFPIKAEKSFFGLTSP